MADLESIISASLSGLDGRESSDDGGGSDSNDGSDGTIDTTAADASADASVDAGDNGDPALAEGDQTATTDDGVDPVAAAAAAALEAEGDPFAKEHGLTEPKEGQRENRIPYVRVKAIATNAQKKTFEALTGEKLKEGETIEQGVARFQSEYAHPEHGYTAMRQRQGSYDQIGHIMETNPEQFVQMLVTANPEYKNLLITPELREQLTARKNAELEGQLGPEPEPDLDYNGARTYSLEGLKAREAWLLKRAKIEQKQMLDEALKPYRERDEAAAMTDQTVQKVRSAMEVAKEWDGFQEHMPDILAHLKTLPRRGESHLQLLVKAYLGVVIPKYKADRQKMRMDILNELRKAPAATSVKQASRAGAPKNVAQAANPSAPRDLEDVIKASIKGIAR